MIKTASKWTSLSNNGICPGKGMKQNISITQLQNNSAKGIQEKKWNFFLNSFPASGNFCHLLTIFANSLDPYQVQQNVGLFVLRFYGPVNPMG